MTVSRGILILIKISVTSNHANRPPHLLINKINLCILNIYLKQEVLA